MSVKSTLRKIMFKLPYIGRRLELVYNCGYEPGHYYSSIPDLNDIRNRRSKIFKKTGIDIKGINLRKEEQFTLLEQFLIYYKDIPYDFQNAASTNTRYQINGAFYRYSDVVMLYSMMRHFQPSKIIEVGSGYSSAVILDTNELFLNSAASLTFIDPYITRLLSLLKEEDKKKCRIIQSIIQDIDPDTFRSLERNDILFIDSSHTSKVGSDLNYILFEILPVLKSGVIIHFHDIYYPFELPEHWVFEKKWFWNENYILRAYLTDNERYDIINFNSYLLHEYKSWLTDHMPVCLMGSEDTGSIWIRKK
jgi:Methyltransferase domain